jgi:hypothetical protein
MALTYHYFISIIADNFILFHTIRRMILSNQRIVKAEPAL